MVHFGGLSACNVNLSILILEACLPPESKKCRFSNLVQPMPCLLIQNDINAIPFSSTNSPDQTKRHTPCPSSFCFSALSFKIFKSRSLTGHPSTFLTLFPSLKITHPAAEATIQARLINKPTDQLGRL
jgi:hypothetical protein